MLSRKRSSSCLHHQRARSAACVEPRAARVWLTVYARCLCSRSDVDVEEVAASGAKVIISYPPNRTAHLSNYSHTLENRSSLLQRLRECAPARKRWSNRPRAVGRGRKELLLLLLPREDSGGA